MRAGVVLGVLMTDGNHARGLLSVGLTLFCFPVLPVPPKPS